MLLGFKTCCMDLYLSVHAALEYVIYFCSDWLNNEDYALPDLTGCWFRPNSYNAKAALCGCTEPLVIGETLDSLLGLQVLRLFPASSGPLGGTEALLESTFEA